MEDFKIWKNSKKEKEEKEEKENKKEAAAPKTEKKDADALTDQKLETVTGGGFPGAPRVPENDIDDETKGKF